MRKPSIRTLEANFPGKGRALRRLLDSDEAVEQHPAVIAWLRDCFNRPKTHELRMCALDAELENYGVEYVPAGHNKRSPAFYYSNSGDAYTTTIMRIEGRYVVGCWGDIVERGNYD